MDMDRVILKYSEDKGYHFALACCDDETPEKRWKDKTFWEALRAFEIFLNIFQKRKKADVVGGGMNDTEYVNAQYQLMAVARLIEEIDVQFIDIDGFLARIAKTETIAPTIDPTFYREAGDALEKIKRLAEAFEGFQKAIKTTREKGRQR